MSKSALASLTAQYTDSENEDENTNDSQNSEASQVIIPKIHSPMQTPQKQHTATEHKKKKRSKKSVRRLVSYQDDTVISDEEGEGKSFSESSEEESVTEEDNEEGIVANSTNDFNRRDTAISMEEDEFNEMTKEEKSPNKNEKFSKYAHYGFALPPEPKGKPLPELTERINDFYDRMKTHNVDMNRIIQDRKEFRNPSIYEKLIQFCDINEFGTNYLPEIYDPLQWGAESYYEELARVQEAEMIKRKKNRKDTDKIEQATALARKVEEEAKKRKSKWDQPAAVKTVLPPATLTTTVTGTKGTVISAFGSLPKKPVL